MSAELRQPLDSLGRQAGQRIPYAASRDDAVRCDLRQWRQYEGALEQVGVRQCQLRLIDGHVVIGDQVEVEGARTPAFFLGAVAAEPFLDFVQSKQQRVRVEA